MKGLVRSLILSAGITLSPGISKAQEGVATQCVQILEKETPRIGNIGTIPRDETIIARDLLDPKIEARLGQIFGEALDKLGFTGESVGEKWESLRKKYRANESPIEPWSDRKEFYEQYRSSLASLLKQQFYSIEAPKINTRIYESFGKFYLEVFSRHNAVYYHLLNGYNPNNVLDDAIMQLEKGNLSHDNFHAFLSCHIPTLEQYLGKFREKTPTQVQKEQIGESPLNEVAKGILSLLQEEGVAYTIEGNKIFLSSDGIFIRDFDLSEGNLDQQLSAFLESYTFVKLADYAIVQPQSESRIELGVTHTESIQNIEVRKKYALQFQKYSKLGFVFVVEDDQKEKPRILALHESRVIAEVQNEHEYSFEFFFLTLEKFDSNSMTDKSLGYAVSPKSKKIAFINHIYKTFIQEKQKYPILDEILSSAETYGIGGQEAIQIAFQIYQTLDNKGLKIYFNIYSNPELFIPSWTEFLAKYRIQIRDYGALRTAYTNYYFGLVNAVIQKNSTISPTSMMVFIERIYRMDLSRGLKAHYSEEQGVPMLVKHLLSTALSIRPELFESQEMSFYFERFPELKNILSTGQSNRIANSRILSGSQGGTGLDLANSIRISGEYDIFVRIRDMKISGTESMSEKEKGEIKLAISRNLAIAHLDDTEEFLIRFDARREVIVQEELDRILKQRQQVFPEAIFAGRSLYHLAHFGQGVDAFGTPGTQNALKSQAKGGAYSLFDAETLKGKKASENSGKVQAFYDAFIKEAGPAVFLAEGHANADGFLILDDYTSTDALEIVKENHARISLDPKKLADIIIKRSFFRQKQKIQGNDIFIFAACKGDFVMNVVNELQKRKNEYQAQGISPPIIITAAEAGENSLFSPSENIPYEILRVGLSIGESESSTFGSFFARQHSEGMKSNPGVFYPDRSGVYRQLF